MCKLSSKQVWWRDCENSRVVVVHPRLVWSARVALCSRPAGPSVLEENPSQALRVLHSSPALAAWSSVVSGQSGPVGAAGTGWRTRGSVRFWRNCSVLQFPLFTPPLCNLIRLHTWACSGHQPKTEEFKFFVRKVSDVPILFLMTGSTWEEYKRNTDKKSKI